MQPYTILLTLLPSLAIAQDYTAVASSIIACTKLPDVVAKESCVYNALGVKPAAASYAASVDHDPALSGYLVSAVSNSAIASDLTAAALALHGSLPTDLNFLGLEASVIVQHITDVPSGTERDVASSVFAEINSLQATGAPAKAFAPKQTGLGVMAGVVAGVVGVAVAL